MIVDGRVRGLVKDRKVKYVVCCMSYVVETVEE